MRKLVIAFIVLAAFGLAAPPAQAAPVYLSEIALKSSVDNLVYNDGTFWPPAGADLSGFDMVTGMGTIKYIFSGPGTYYVAGFFDYYIDPAFTDEVGALWGAPATGILGLGQSWEIDEPGWLFGDIYTNFFHFDAGRPLPNTNDIPAAGEDVSVALGYTFTIDPGGPDKHVFFTVMQRPPSGYYLEQYDPQSQTSVYFQQWSQDDVGPGPAVPEPGTITLVGLGLAAAARRLRRR